MTQAHAEWVKTLNQARILDRIRKELATNFDIPARDIIQMGCAELGITESAWRKLESEERGERS
jgi:hypothetical protein